MKTCFYHPVSPATYYCQQCRLASCDTCSDVVTPDQVRCFHCEASLQGLGAAHSAKPFWRRIDASFKYAMHKEVLIFLGVVAVLGAVVSYLPFGPLWQLLLSGVMMKYCFNCLQASSQGIFTPPDISESYSRGLETLAKLLVVIIGILAMCFGAISLLGAGVGGILSLLLCAALPGAIIILALTDSVMQAMNPFKLMQLIVSIGLPYGLVLGFILMMSSSVAVLHGLFGDNMSMVSVTLQSFVSNFYSIVMFHIMGYMIFQYQGQLGFVAREDDHDFIAASALDKCKARLSMSLKDGDFEQLLLDYVAAINKFPQEAALAEQCFELLYASGNKAHIDEFGSFYLERLIKQGKDYQVRAVHKRLLTINPGFKADTADTRWKLAGIAFDAGDFKAVVQLLAALHKEFPDFAQLGQAYQLLAQSLEQIPGQQAKALQVAAISARLIQQQERAGAKKPARPSAAQAAEKPVLKSIAEPQAEKAIVPNKEATSSQWALVPKDDDVA